MAPSIPIGVHPSVRFAYVSFFTSASERLGASIPYFVNFHRTTYMTINTVLLFFMVTRCTNSCQHCGISTKSFTMSRNTQRQKWLIGLRIMLRPIITGGPTHDDWRRAKSNLVPSLESSRFARGQLPKPKTEDFLSWCYWCLC